jgi:hypothetical protein
MNENDMGTLVTQGGAHKQSGFSNTEPHRHLLVNG